MSNLSKEMRIIAKEKANQLVVTFGKHLALKCMNECYFFSHDIDSMAFIIETVKQIKKIK
jgi:hypothetical protein